MSRGGLISEEYNLTGPPAIYVLDAKGVIRFKGVRGEAMDRVESLVSETEGERK